MKNALVFFFIKKKYRFSSLGPASLTPTHRHGGGNSLRASWARELGIRAPMDLAGLAGLAGVHTYSFVFFDGGKSYPFFVRG